jgi:hypothetical protein
MIYGLNPATGKVVAERLVESEHAGAMDPPPSGAKHAMPMRIRQNTLDYKTFLAPDGSDAFSMRGATSDILVADEASIYLRHMRFDDELAAQVAGRAHLYSTSRLLDDYEHNRSYWILGTGDLTRTPVAYPWIIRKDLAVPFGLMMAFSEQTVWAVRRGTGKRAAKSGLEVVAMPRGDPSDVANAAPDFQKRTVGGHEATGFSWQADVSGRVRAMLRAGGALVVAGGDEGGGFLHVLSAGHGVSVSERPLEAAPVWDGLAAARGRLYVALENGWLLCLGGR